jgi:hypothetical protein
MVCGIFSKFTGVISRIKFILGIVLPQTLEVGLYPQLNGPRTPGGGKVLFNPLIQ